MTTEAEEPLVSETKEETPPPAPFHAVVSADLFRRAQLACNPKGTILSTLGVYIDACPEGGAILTAHNGHYLISIRDPYAVVRGSGIVRLNKLMLRALKAEKQDLEFTERVLLFSDDTIAPPRALVASVGIEDRYDARELAFELFDAPDEHVKAVQYSDCRIDGQFPDYRKVIPNYIVAGQSCATFNPEALKAIGQALAPYNKTTPTLTFFTHPVEPVSHPILIKGAKFPLIQSDLWFEGVAVLITLKGETEAQRPDWLRAKAA